jgi:hypothetical protein
MLAPLLPHHAFQFVESGLIEPRFAMLCFHDLTHLSVKLIQIFLRVFGKKLGYDDKLASIFVSPQPIYISGKLPKSVYGE